MHGRGAFTDAQGDWTYSGALEQNQPTEDELVDADGGPRPPSFLEAWKVAVGELVDDGGEHVDAASRSHTTHPCTEC